MDAATSLQPGPSNGGKEDAFSSPEDPPSNSASPNSQILGLDRMASPSASPSAGTESRANIPSVPAACLACRGKHLKCDGQNPCSRCTSSNSECIYVASRRGYKGPRRGTARNPNKRHASSPARESTSSTEGPVSFAPATSVSMRSITCLNPALTDDLAASPFSTSLLDPALTSNGNGNGNSDISLFRPYGMTDGAAIEASELALSHHQGVVPAQVPIPTPAERCLDSFYHHFHAAHPFVLPKEYLLRIAKETTLEPLLAAMRWIGSLYIEACPHRASFFQEARRLAYDSNRSKDGFLVQALLLLLIGLDGQGHQDKAREILADAERLAVRIGLNTRPFATLHGRGMAVLEESWRRTWWDLYVVDGMIAGVHRSTNFLLFDEPCDVALPCEEYQYLSGDIPQPMYLEDMDDIDFSGEDREFSSFAYRIQCARNLGKFMRVPPIYGPDDENLARIETLLTNWRLHLPVSKQDSLGKDGRLDEMMFQAHMMMHATSILLHQPHSQLDSSSTRPVNSCAPHAPVPSGDAFNAHTKHTIQSATEISKLITNRVSLLSHTHFFTCVITLSSIVHLSKWALFFVPHDDDNLRQQIRLNIGALSKMSMVWGNADRAGRQVKGVAQEIYRAKKQQQMTPQYWLGLTQEEVLNSIAADDSIINEIENMQSMPGLSGMIG
ncbi:Zn(2)-C6 fungal-type domain-containing protein [Fusarium sp. LHS14.1]|nr:Zn(2)-C6 fungal-type domain-containing protein [Fusarium sp. LHS14.1]